MQVWDHVERRYIEVESVWNGRGTLPGDSGAGFIQRPGSELFREGESEETACDADSADSPRRGRPVDTTLRERILRDAANLSVREAAARLGCSPTTIVRARRSA